MEKPNKTDQQATNDALAALAAAGNTFALGQLWEINKGFIKRQLWQWYEKNKSISDAAGLAFEDLEQEGYFAVQNAAAHYDPTKGNFSTFLSYYIKNRIVYATSGEHRVRYEREDGRVVAVSANPLNNCTSLDVHLDSDDDGSSTRGDLIEDPAASQAFQQAEETIYNHELHDAIEEALSALPERHAYALRRRYYDGLTLGEVGEELHVQRERVRQIEQHAFRQLKQNEQLARWADEILSGYAWHGTGFGAWTNGGSVEERAVERLERMKAERQARLEQAEREQKRRREEEWQAFLESSGYYDLHPERRPAGLSHCATT